MSTSKWEECRDVGVREVESKYTATRVIKDIFQLAVQFAIKMLNIVININAPKNKEITLIKQTDAKSIERNTSNRRMYTTK